MKRKKTIIGLVMSVCLLLNIPFVSANDGSNYSLKSATEYASLDSIPKVQLEKVLNQAEKSELVNSFVNEAKSNGVSVEGIYFDENKGKYVVQVLDENQIEQLSKFNKNQGDFEFEKVKNSMAMLESYITRLESLQKEKEIQGLRGHWIDVQTNSVVALVEEDDPSTKSKLVKYINEDALQVAKLISIDFNVKSGDKIADSTGGCTAAFHGKKGSQDVLITAGHCGYNGIGNSWKFGTTTIGTFGAKTSGNTNADAGYINLSSSSYVEVTEKATGGVIGGANDAGNESVGDYIYVSAPYTGYILQGIVQATNVSIDAGGQYGFNTLSGLRLTTAVNSSGDSGAPVMKLRFNAEKDRAEYILQGVNNGNISYSLNGTVSNLEWYSAYKNVYNSLGLSSIYVAA
ncbi:chymotrypsin family serine protease [Cohnella fermenti]|uniref:Serine protease n=1 Tax=Cohnella fermenti TaxID=2565925 RepID=A0A4S4BY64_9BACL|nr:hypothetical protein [Cohnella fermenti]THF78082.1 hypothetical protein E6C55_15425 [Cohnella fermenti]